MTVMLWSEKVAYYTKVPLLVTSDYSSRVAGMHRVKMYAKNALKKKKTKIGIIFSFILHFLFVSCTPYRHKAEAGVYYCQAV